MKRIRKSLLTLAAAASLLFGASIAVTPATAAPVTFLFTGVVDVSGVFVGDVANVGDPFNVTITYDSSLFSGDSHGFFNPAILDVDVTYPTSAYHVEFGNSALNFIQIANNGANDAYLMHAPLDAFIPASPTVNGFRPLSFDVEFFAPHSFLSSGSPSLSSISGTRGTLTLLANGLVQQIVSGPMTPVPLPPAVILFGAGIVALIGLGARNWQLKGSSVA